MTEKSKNLPDPLDTLFVSGDEVNRELLARILRPYLRLDEKGGVYPLNLFSANNLTNRQQIVLLLLARKAYALKTNSDEWIGPTELSKLCNIPGGSLRPTLRMLVEERIAEEEGGRYRINPFQLQKCLELFEKRKEPEAEGGRIREGSAYTPVSMRQAVEELMRQGGLDEPKRASEILRSIERRRPGTKLAPLYGVIIALVKKGSIARERKDDTWMYKKVG